jgi:hypothetical protein
MFSYYDFLSTIIILLCSRELYKKWKEIIMMNTIFLFSASTQSTMGASKKITKTLTLCVQRRKGFFFCASASCLCPMQKNIVEINKKNHDAKAFELLYLDRPGNGSFF